MTHSPLPRARFAAIVLLVAAVSIARSDEGSAPWHHVTSSASGRYYFRMETPTGSDPGRGTMYRTQRGGRDEPLWSVAGWYAERVFVADNGESLVRLGNWPDGSGPSEEDLGVAFYTRGELVRRWSTKELIRDETAVRPTVSHYEFLDDGLAPGIAGQVVNGRFGYPFQLRTVDQITYLFDFTTGKVLADSTTEPEIVGAESAALAIAEAVLTARFDTQWSRGKGPQPNALQARRIGDSWYVDAVPTGAGASAPEFHVRLLASDGRVTHLEKRP